MNDYEKKQEAKRERLEQLAAKAQNESNATYERARSMASVIPFGQPILVGHHSEGSDRNYRKRIHNAFGKSFALQQKAEHYQNKADRIGAGGISGDDPEAIAKLRAELETLASTQERMKTANQIIRKHKGDEERQVAELIAANWSDAQARKLLAPDFGGRIGFPAYSLTNNSANIRRIKQRIEDLEKLSNRQQVETKTDGYTYREDKEENRVMFIFDGKPAEEVRAVLKRHAFKWSPSRNAWVRQLTAAGIYAGGGVKAYLDSSNNI